MYATDTDTMDHLAAMLTTYNELNPPDIEELDGEPDALGFMRFVAKNRPFVARGAARQWKAVREWSPAVLAARMVGRKVNVAVTPNG